MTRYPVRDGLKTKVDPIVQTIFYRTQMVSFLSERLYAKIGRLNMELEWLKKSLGSAFKPTVGLGQC